MAAGGGEPHDRAVTWADVELSLRLPAWARAWLVAFPVLFVAAQLFIFRPHDGGPGLPALLFAACAAAVSWQGLRLGATGSADSRLAVRNRWSTPRLHRDDIAGVGITDIGGGFMSAVTLHLRDGSALTLDATEGLGFAPMRRRMEREAARLRNWVDDRPQPFV